MKHNFDNPTNRKGTFSTQWDYIEDRFGEKNLLPFSISDTDFECPSVVVDALQEVIQQKIYGYTRWNHATFKDAIVQHFTNRFGCNVNEEAIVYSPSVIYSISLLLELLVQKGDGVLVFDPMYDAFKGVICENGYNLVACALSKNTYKIEEKIMEKKLKQAKVFLLCSPHNPTGRVWNEAELEMMVRLCQKHKVWIISDEIHMDILLFGSVHHPIITYYNQYQKMILVGSASKTFNTPGLGGSYAIVYDKQIRQSFLHHTRSCDGVNSANIFGMHALIAAYDAGSYYIDGLCSYIEGNMIVLKNYLSEHLPNLKFALPNATYLAWIDTSNSGFTPEEIQDALIHVGKVAIMDGSVYGQQGISYLRMNVGCPTTKLVQGLKKMKAAFDFLDGCSYVE